MYKPKHFRLEELAPKDVVAKEGVAAWAHFDPRLLKMIDDLRDFFGVPMVVNTWLWQFDGWQYRGLRPPDCTVGAEQSEHRLYTRADGSVHLCGAVDFDVKGLTAAQGRTLILQNQHDQRLAEVRRLEGGVNWIHADIGAPPEWAKAGEIYVFTA